MVPAFCATIVPGASAVPFAERVIPFTFRPSTATVPAFRRKLPAHMVRPVVAPVRDPAPHLRQVPLRPFAPFAALPAPRKPALQAPRLRLQPRQVRHLVKFAVAVRDLASVPVQAENAPVARPPPRTSTA